MLKIVLLAVVAIVLFIIVYIARVMFLVWRFSGDMGLVNILREWFFQNDDMYEIYKEQTMTLLVGKQRIEFENFAAAVNYLEIYVDIMLEDYQKIIDLTEYYELSEYEQVLKDIKQQARMWKWEHGELDTEET